MFSKKLKDLRKSKGLTQVEFAKIFNIATGTIAMWETGKREPDYETIRKIAKFFNVSVDYLLSVDEKEQKKIRPSEEERILKLMNENKSFSELIEIMATLSEDELDKLADYTRWRAAELEKEHQK